MKVKNRTLKQTILIFVSILIMFTTITPGFARAEVSLYPFVDYIKPVAHGIEVLL